MAAPPQLSGMPTPPHGGEVTIRPYLVGAVLALVLTAIPFGLVAARALRPIQIVIVIGVAAIAQVVVQTDRAVLRRRRAPHSGRRHAMDHVRRQLPHDAGGGEMTQP